MNPNIYRQYDDRWGSLAYPGSGSNLANSGCGCLSVFHCAIELNKNASLTVPQCRKVMVKYATVDNGTIWSGITKGLEHYGYEVHWKESDGMDEIFSQLKNSLNRGVILFAKKKAKAIGPDGTLWTTDGHYIMFADYKIENGKHWFYLKDSGSRNHDGWYAYEKSMKGCVRNLWICKSAEDTPAPTPTPTPDPTPTPKKPYTGKYPVVKKYLEPGDHGENVTRLQNYLNWYTDGEFFKKCGKADGIYGKNTLKYAKKMQADFFGASEADGLVGNKTIGRMKEYGANPNPAPAPAPTPTPAPATDYKVIDISYVQKGVDFNKVKADGIDGVIIRCGYRGYETGALNEDSQFQTHIKAAHAAGLPVGVYFFTEAINAAEGREEAAYTLNIVKKMGIPLSYPIAIDTEYINVKKGEAQPRANNIGKAKRTEAIKAFCEEIKAQGYEPMIYASLLWFKNNLDMSQLPYKVWCAQYYDKCEYSGDYVMWQYTSEGKVDGISGAVDMNRCYIEPSPTPTPAPEPTPEPTPEPKKYGGSYPTEAEIKSASNYGIRKKICSFAKKTAASGKYVYVKFVDAIKATRECPVCHPHDGKQGGNCIWYPFFSWRHGGGLKNRCSCEAMTDQLWEKVLKAKTDAEANEIVRKRLKIDDVEVIRNGGKEIPQSMLRAADIVAYFSGSNYTHTALEVFNNLIADCTSGRTPNVKYGVNPYTKWDIKVAIRFTGGNSYIALGDEGDAVKKLQDYLDWYFDGAFFAACGPADGVFGKNTYEWTKKMQTDFFGAAEADATVGMKTVAKMKEVTK